jgi:hypothetical protein
VFGDGKAVWHIMNRCKAQNAARYHKRIGKKIGVAKPNVSAFRSGVIQVIDQAK